MGPNLPQGKGKRARKPVVSSNMQAPADTAAPINIAFVASCLNEAGNVAELHRRCLETFEAFAAAHPRQGGWAFQMTLADNGSTDDTAKALMDLAVRDPRVQVLVNSRNYGPEPSVVNVFENTQADLYVLLASDLQDPPELVKPMLERLLTPGSKTDAVLACKRSLPKGPLLHFGRALYYQLLAFGTRSQRAPNGFHGFGVFRAEVVRDTVDLWKHTAMSLRQAMARSSHAAEQIPYQSSTRQTGHSSYGLMGYVQEAMGAVFSGDAITTRLTMRLGVGALLIAVLLGLAVTVNVLRGTSGYAAGTPTLMLLVLASLGIQSLLLSMLSFQIENLNLPMRRPAVRCVNRHHNGAN